jgi:signal peptidase I
MNKKKAKPPRKEKKKAGPVQRTIRDVVIIVAAYVFIRLWVVEANVIPSGSMEDTLLVGDYVLAEKVTYHFRDPRPGEVVTFIAYAPLPNVLTFRDMNARAAIRFFLRNILGETRTGPRLLIKRVVGTPGDVLELKDHVLYRNGEAVDEPYVKTDAGDPAGIGGTRYSIPLDVPYKVPRGRFFMMGDNRYDSQDSRVIGPVPRKYITAKAEIIYFSFTPVKCAKHRAPIARVGDRWICLAGAEEARVGWDFVPTSRWRFDRRVRWSRMGELVRLLR